MKKQKMTYEQSGVNYGSLDPAKNLDKKLPEKLQEI
jgi:hypothetical protein